MKYVGNAKIIESLEELPKIGDIQLNLKILNN